MRRRLCTLSLFMLLGVFALATGCEKAADDGATTPETTEGDTPATKTDG